MTIYAVFDKEATEAPAVVPDRFSWFAMLLPPLFALIHGLWLVLLGYVVFVVALGAAGRIVGGGAAFWIYVLVAIWIGFEAPAFRRGKLRLWGWRYRTEVIARSADLAELEGLRSRPAR